MANNLGDFDASAVIYGKFTTFRPSTGATYTLGGTPALSVYKDNSTTQSTAGVTLTADFDSVTGLNHFAIDTSADGTFYSAGSFFDVVITTGTVDSVSVTGSCVGQFTIRKTSALKPTTAGRALDVSSGGEAGIDWANIGSPTTTVNLSGTTVSVATSVTNRVTANADQIDGVSWSTHAAGMAPADLRDISGSAVSTSTAQLGVNIVNVKGSASAGAAGYVGIDWSAINAPTTAVNLSGTTISTSQAIASVSGAVGSVTGNVGGNVTGTLGGFTTAALAEFFTTDTGKVYSDAVAGSVVYEIATNSGGGTYPTVQQIVDGVWDEPIASHLSAGSTGEALNAAGSAGDPWITSLPGSYTSGQAGYIVGTYLDLAVSSRLAPTVASRTLDVTATGAAGIDWGNVENPTTSLNLSGTTISTSQAVASVAGAVGSVTGNVGGNVTGSLGSFTTAALAQFFTTDTGEVYADAVPGSVVYEIAENSGGGGGSDPWAVSLPGSYTSGQAGYILGTNLDAAVTTRLAPTVAGRSLDVTSTGAAGIDWANVENPTTSVNLSGTTISTSQIVASVTGAVGSVTGGVGGGVAGSVNSVNNPVSVDSVTSGVVQDIVDGVWDEARSSHTTSGTFGQGVASVQGNVTGSVASVTGFDPALIDVATSTRLASADYVVPPTANENADALLTRTDGIETDLTVQQGLRVMVSAMAGKADGLAGTTVHYRDTSDTLNRITAVCDQYGNRTSVTLNTG